MLQSSLQVQSQANRCRNSAPVYSPGHQGSSAAGGVPEAVFAFTGLVQRGTDGDPGLLNSPASMRVHQPFHISRVKPVGQCPMSPLVDSASLPRIVDSVEAYLIHQFLFRGRVMDTSTLGTRRVMVQRSGPGCRDNESWTRVCCRISTGPSRISRFECSLGVMWRLASRERGHLLRLSCS